MSDPAKKSRLTFPTLPISPKDELLLKSLLRYHSLTAVQIRRLFYGPNSLNTARERVARLVKAGIVLQSTIPTGSPNPPAIYSLATPGRNYLAEQGYEVPPRFRPIDAQQTERPTLHTKELNDFLIEMELHLNNWSEVIEWELLHERDIKRKPFRVTIQVGEKGNERNETITFLPDAWITLTYKSTKQRCIAVELDRGTETQWIFRRKVKAYVSFHEHIYPTQFAGIPLTIAVVATPSVKRANDLKRWIEAEMEGLGYRKRGHLFRLAYLASETQSQAVFSSPCWYRPFDAEPLGLWPIRQVTSRK